VFLSVDIGNHQNYSDEIHCFDDGYRWISVPGKQPADGESDAKVSAGKELIPLSAQ